MKYLKGSVVKHPKLDWGKGVVLEEASGPTVKIRFEKGGLKTLLLQHIDTILLDDHNAFSRSRNPCRSKTGSD